MRALNDAVSHKEHESQYLTPLSTMYCVNNMYPTNFYSTVYRAESTSSTCGSKFVSSICNNISVFALSFLEHGVSCNN